MSGTQGPRPQPVTARELSLRVLAALERRPYVVLCGTVGAGFILAAGLSPSLIAFTARAAGGAVVSRLVGAALASSSGNGSGTRSLGGPGGEG